MSTTNNTQAAVAPKSPSFLHRVFHHHAKDTATTTTKTTTPEPATVAPQQVQPQKANPDLESYSQLMDVASTLPPADFKVFLQEYKTETEAQDRRRESVGNGRGILAHEGADVANAGATKGKLTTYPCVMGQMA